MIWYFGTGVIWINIPGTGIQFTPYCATKTSGPYENQPSGETVLLWWTGGTIQNIFFNEPVCGVSFFYSSIPNVQIQAFDAEINLSGASDATINASGRLDGDLSGASKLSYVGNPTLGSINTSGGSTISQK